MTLLDSLRVSEGEVLPSWALERGLRRLSFLRSSGSFFIFMERRRTVPGDLTRLRERPFLGAPGLEGGDGAGSPAPELTQGMGIFAAGRERGEKGGQRQHGVVTTILRLWNGWGGKGGILGL